MNDITISHKDENGVICHTLTITNNRVEFIQYYGLLMDKQRILRFDSLKELFDSIDWNYADVEIINPEKDIIKKKRRFFR